MGFSSGHQKSGGRIKGTPNLITAELRAVLRLILAKEFETLPETISAIKSPERRLEMIVKLLPYVIPRAQEITLESLPDEKLDFIISCFSDEKAREN
jgi:hypothetical protein